MTHLPCRAARYTSTTGEASLANVQKTAFPVTPGGTMPPIEGYEKKDYAVIFVIGVAAEVDRR